MEEAEEAGREVREVKEDDDGADVAPSDDAADALLMTLLSRVIDRTSHDRSDGVVGCSRTHTCHAVTCTSCVSLLLHARPVSPRRRRSRSPALTPPVLVVRPPSIARRRSFAVANARPESDM
jgi:hypothetical protein